MNRRRPIRDRPRGAVVIPAVGDFATTRNDPRVGEAVVTGNLAPR